MERLDASEKPEACNLPIKGSSLTYQAPLKDPLTQVHHIPFPLILFSIFLIKAKTFVEYYTLLYNQIDMVIYILNM